MLKPQPKTKEILEYLVDCINTHTKPTQLEVKRTEREARRLPISHDIHITLGYLYTATGDYNKAESQFKNALASTYANDETISDLAMLYTQASKMSKARDVLIDALKQYPHSIILNRSLHTISFQGLDIDNYLLTYDTLKKMKPDIFKENEDSAFRHFIHCYCCDDDTKKKVKAVGNEIFNLIDKHSLTLTSQALLQLPETDHMSCVYKVLCKEKHIESFDLNWDFTEQIVDEDLLDTPIVINFQVINSNRKSWRA